MFPLNPQSRFGENAATHLFWVAPLIAAAAATTAAGISAAEARHQGNKTRDFNSEQAEINREWQERMANTSYQRGVADMEKAGINPMLSAWNGGAPVPGGAQASVGQQTSSSQALSQLGSNLSNAALGVSSAQLNSADAKLANAQAESEKLKPNILREQKNQIVEETRERKALADIRQNEAVQSAYNRQFVAAKAHFMDDLRNHYPRAYSALMFLNAVADSPIAQRIGGTAMDIIRNKMSMPKGIGDFIEASTDRSRGHGR